MRLKQADRKVLAREEFNLYLCPLQLIPPTNPIGSLTLLPAQTQANSASILPQKALCNFANLAAHSLPSLRLKLADDIFSNFGDSPKAVAPGRASNLSRQGVAVRLKSSGSRQLAGGEKSRCGVEVWRGGLGGTYRLPALSVAGASLVPPCFRFHTPSRPGEFRPEPLTDPCLTVSSHTARAIHEG